MKVSQDRKESSSSVTGIVGCIVSRVILWWRWEWVGIVSLVILWWWEWVGIVGLILILWWWWEWVGIVSLAVIWWWEWVGIVNGAVVGFLPFFILLIPLISLLFPILLLFEHLFLSHFVVISLLL